MEKEVDMLLMYKFWCWHIMDYSKIQWRSFIMQVMDFFKKISQVQNWQC